LKLRDRDFPKEQRIMIGREAFKHQTDEFKSYATLRADRSEACRIQFKSNTGFSGNSSSIETHELNRADKCQTLKKT